MMWRDYALTIGLPQTNHSNFAEAKLLMEACNFFWWRLGEAIQRPIAQLRTASGEPVYATITFIDETFPPDRTLPTFRLDDRLTFLVGIRAIKNLAVEGLVVFDREDQLPSTPDHDSWWDRVPPHPVIRFGSIFATPGKDNQLRLAAPMNAVFQDLPPLPPDDSPLQLARRAQETGRLGVVPDAWSPLDRHGPTEVTYAIDPDRDTNAAGLVYFAHYAAMMELGERRAIPQPGQFGWRFPSVPLEHRQLLRRRVAYFGNAGLFDQVAIAVSRFASSDHPGELGLRYQLTRASDRKLICLSEALMTLAPHSQPPERPLSKVQRAGALS